MEEIIVKIVHDKEGFFNHIELHQGNNIIKVSLGNTSLDQSRRSYKWDNLKDVIERIRKGLQ